VNKRKLFATAIAGVAAALCAFSSLAADRSDIFSVSVPLDATAANANAARDAARRDGEKRAYLALLRRLTLASDRSRLPEANDAALNELVQGFEVANERRSSVRYLADYTFHFRSDAIERLLRDQGIPFAETVSKPLLVLPVLESANGPVLWDDPNPWRDAWTNADLGAGLVPFVRPLGAIEDVTAIDAKAADDGDDAHLQAIAGNYGNGDVLVTRATIRQAGDAKSADVTSTRFAPGNPGGEQTWVTTLPANAGESDRDLLDRAALATADQVAEAWKQANIIDYKRSGTLTVSVPMRDLPGWVAVRSRLSGIPSIQRVELNALDRQRALVTLHYVGAAEQLRLALAQRDLDLSGEDPDLVLQRRSPGAPAEPLQAAPPAEPPAAPAPTETNGTSENPSQ